MKKSGVFFGFLALILMVAVPIMAADCDVVITNGRGMDPETRLDAVRHVGITVGRNTAITVEKITGKKAIDA